MSDESINERLAFLESEIKQLKDSIILGTYMENQDSPITSMEVIVSSGYVTFKWKLNTKSAYYYDYFVVVRKMGSYSEDINDGQIAYKDGFNHGNFYGDGGFIDEDLINGIEYYYSFFHIDKKGICYRLESLKTKCVPKLESHPSYDLWNPIYERENQVYKWQDKSYYIENLSKYKDDISGFFKNYKDDYFYCDKITLKMDIKIEKGNQNNNDPFSYDKMCFGINLDKQNKKCDLISEIELREEGRKIIELPIDFKLPCSNVCFYLIGNCDENILKTKVKIFSIEFSKIKFRESYCNYYKKIGDN